MVIYRSSDSSNLFCRNCQYTQKLPLLRLPHYKGSLAGSHLLYVTTYAKSISGIKKKLSKVKPGLTKSPLRA